MNDTPSLNVYRSGPVFEEIKKGRLVGSMVDMDGMNNVTVYYCNPQSKVTVWFACCLCGAIIKNAHAVPKHGKICTIPNQTNTKQLLVEVMPSVNLLDGDFGTICNSDGEKDVYHKKENKENENISSSSKTKSKSHQSAPKRKRDMSERVQQRRLRSHTSNINTFK